MGDLINLIFVGLIKNEEFSRSVLPHIKPEYMESEAAKQSLVFLQEYVVKYASLPNVKELRAFGESYDKFRTRDVEEFNVLAEFIEQNDPPKNTEWLFEKCEKYCQERAVYNALIESIAIHDNETKEETSSKDSRTRHAIPEILQKALSVSFKTSIGHDYVDDADERFEHYNLTEEKVPFRLTELNKSSKGGVPPKRLVVPIAGTNVGKSAFLCDWAAFLLTIGKNVGYITLEMPELEVAERIDANLMNMSTEDIRKLPKTIWDKQIERIKTTCPGRIKTKEFPTGIGHVRHFRYLLDEWKMKSNFTPDILFIDYINICASSRYRTNAGPESYGYIKTISEELRGLGVEKGISIISPTQLNRGGFGNSDADLTDIAESFGLSHTADFMFVMHRDEDMARRNEMAIKIVKARWTSKVENSRFFVGFNESRMTFFDLDRSEKSGIMETVENDVKAFSGSGEKKKHNFSGIISE